jgi:hypothetical protein
MVVRAWLYLLDTLKVNFSLHKKIIIWFWIFILAGIAVAIISIPRQEITVDDISIRLIDKNIVNSSAVDSTLTGFIWGRLLSVFLPLALLFLFCILSNATALVVFPFMALQGYWLVMTVWWTMNQYALSSVLLLAFYAVWLVLMLQVLIAYVIWVMKLSASVRRVGFRCGFNMREFLVGTGVIVGVEVLSAVIEYLVYFVFLARIIYGPTG